MIRKVALLVAALGAAVAVPAAVSAATDTGSVTLCATGSSVTYSKSGTCPDSSTPITVPSGDALQALSSRVTALEGRVADLDRVVDVLLMPSVDAFPTNWTDGVSYTADVFGQHLQPGSTVTVTAGGQTIGTATVTDQGAPEALTVTAPCDSDLELTATSVVGEPVTSTTPAFC